MSIDTTVPAPAADVEPLRSAVDRAAAALATDGRLAGPAAPQDDAEALLPSGDPVGVFAELSDGSMALVLVAASALAGPGGAANPDEVIEALAPIIDTLAEAAGLTALPASFTDAAPIPPVFDPALGGVLLGAGIFEGDQVIASVAAMVGVPVVAAPVSTPIPSVPGLPNLGLLVDVELGVTVELGRSTVSMGSLLDMRPGSVLELDRAAGSLVDILVNGTLLGRGEVIVVENAYAVRITEIVADGVER